MSETNDRLEYVENELERIKFEMSRSLNIDMSGKTPDPNVPPQPERNIVDQGRPQLAAPEAPAASYETQDGPDSTGPPTTPQEPVVEGVKPGTSELIVDSGGGQGTGPVVTEEDNTDATDAAQRKADELGVTLADVKGTGADNRVTVADVQKHADKQKA